jgi:hypothetical protein
LVVIALLASAGAASGDVSLRVRESSWSLGKNPPQSESIVETAVRNAMRRVETHTGKSGAIQVDRIDRDTSFYFRPGDSLYLPLALAQVRATNRKGTRAFADAQANGTAPRDTLAPVRMIDLGRSRTILGTVCKGQVLELVFSYRDSTGTELTGVLSDTVWLAPASSAPGDLKRFERDFARATASDSFLSAANAVQLAQARGQGLVSVLQRALRALPGYPLESTFVNLLHGLPRGLNLGDGVERRADGSVVIQRTVREALSLSDAPLAPDRFEVPKGAKPVATKRP